ncbi:hypothetical protein BHM03_00053892, partial [Ensete ventricosum]
PAYERCAHKWPSLRVGVALQATATTGDTLQAATPMGGWLPLHGAWPWLAAPCLTTFAKKMQHERVEQFYAMQSHHM